MQYDQLEAEYFILLQKNKELEKQNNALYEKNTQLESSNIVLENKLNNTKHRNESLIGELKEENTKCIALQIQLDSLKQEIEDQISGSMMGSILGKDPISTQIKANEKSFLEIPKYSIHRPMEEFKTNQHNIILSVKDSFGAYKSPEDYNLHAFAKLDDKIVRYASASMMFLKRNEDFAVVLDQMIEGLKHNIVREYVMSKKPHFDFNFYKNCGV